MPRKRRELITDWHSVISEKKGVFDLLQGGVGLHVSIRIRSFEYLWLVCTSILPGLTVRVL
jgi:hypothetical protein